MGRAVLTCAQCAAPHRPARGQTRFTCDWCGAENTTDEGAKVEELVVAGGCDPAIAVQRTREVLRRRGIGAVRARARAPHWMGLWQVISAEGDEFLAPASARPTRLQSALRLPTASYVAAEPSTTGHALPERSAPERTLEDIVRAARASFADGDAALHAIRLVWIPVCEVEVRGSGLHTRALYVGGSDEVLLEPLPDHATDAPLRPGRLALFAGFAGMAMALGIALDSTFARTVVLAAWFGCGIGALGWVRATSRGRMA